MASVDEFELPASRAGGPPAARGGAGRGGIAGRGGGGGGGGSAATGKRGKKVHSLQEQRELLKEYIKLDPKFWKNIRAGDQIRYYTKEGEFRTGGIVRIPRFRNPRTKTPERELIKIEAEFDSSVTWAAGWDTIRDVYIIPPVALVVMQESLERALRTLNSNAEKIASGVKETRSEVRALGGRVEELEREFKVLRNFALT